MVDGNDDTQRHSSAKVKPIGLGDEEMTHFLLRIYVRDCCHLDGDLFFPRKVKIVH